MKNNINQQAYGNSSKRSMLDFTSRVVEFAISNHAARASLGQATSSDFWPTKTVKNAK
jgi:hypothetical protein